MADATENLELKKAARTPPYVSFKTFLTLLDELKANGIPPQVDRSVLLRFSGGVGSQLVMALKSLGIVEEENRPTPFGVALINSQGTERFNELLRQALSDAYPFLSDFNLMESTPSMFADVFRRGTDAKEDVLRKCRTFYLHAAQHAGISIGPRILKGSVPRAANGTGGRRRARAKERTSAAPPEQHGNGGEQRPQISSMASALLEKFPPFDPAWPEDIKAKWFDGYSRLLTMGEKE